MTEPSSAPVPSGRTPCSSFGKSLISQPDRSCVCVTVKVTCHGSPAVDASTRPRSRTRVPTGFSVLDTIQSDPLIDWVSATMRTTVTTFSVGFQESRAEARQLIDTLRSRTFEANPSPTRCGRCDVRLLCRYRETGAT